MIQHTKYAIEMRAAHPRDDTIVVTVKDAMERQLFGCRMCFNNREEGHKGYRSTPSSPQTTSIRSTAGTLS